MAVEVKPPFPLFTDTAGDPVDGGYIYIGTANTDPAANPIAVFFDAALSVSASQPIRTIGGYPSRNGSAAALFCGGNYSISVRDKNGVEVFTSASAALAGGDITLASGETLTAESGATIDLEDGAALNIGDASGAGVVVTVASNARIAGNIIPTVAGADLGSTSLPYDAFLKAAKVSESILPSTAGVPSIGTTSIPFAGVTSQEVTAKTVAVYSQDQPAATSDLVKIDQFCCMLAACRQISGGSTALTQELRNVTRIDRISDGVYTVIFTVNIGTGVRVALATSTLNGIICSANSSATVCTVTTFDNAGTPTDAPFDLVIFGNPGQTDPIS